MNYECVTCGALVPEVSEGKHEQWHRNLEDPTEARRILESAAPHLTKYPHESGDCVVLGPETFTNKSADVICHKGQNYYLVEDK
jgi:hypothetical protein